MEGTDETGRLRVAPLRADPRPLYVLAEDALRDLRASMGLEAGDRLPSEIELARMLGVSRSTVREALRHLELRGEVRRVHGLGTIVLDHGREIVAGLEVLESMESLADRQGWTCGTVDVRLDTVPMSERVALALARPVDTPGIRLARVKTRDGARIAFMQSFLPADVLSIEELRRRFEGSIIDSLRRLARPRVEYALSTLRVGAADPDAARHLAVAPGLPLLELEEIFCDAADVPFCFNVNSFLPGSVKLELVRRPR